MIYDFRINERGSTATLCENPPDVSTRISPTLHSTHAEEPLDNLLTQNGFDRDQHEWIRANIERGTLGLACNRLPEHVEVEDAYPEDVLSMGNEHQSQGYEEIGQAALEAGEVAIVTLAAGSGTRWSQGSGVVKALNPFAQLSGRHRSFLEVHLAKSRRSARRFGATLPHVFTTSYLTHEPIEAQLNQTNGSAGDIPLYLSRGSAVGLRLVPTERDLRFAWEEQLQEVLDEQKQKVRHSLQEALIRWAKTTGEASNYTDNLPQLCLHPVGHWYEIPNLMLNGTLATLLTQHPALRSLMLHNIDTLGADTDPALLGLHLSQNACLSFEVVPRLFEDRGGGLARIQGRPRLVESLALPRERRRMEAILVQLDDHLGRHRSPARGLRPEPRNFARRETRIPQRACFRSTHANLRNPQRRQTPLGPRPGRRFPSAPVGTTVGRHVVTARSGYSILRSIAKTRSAVEVDRTTRRLASRRLCRAHRVPLRLLKLESDPVRVNSKTITSPRR